VDKYQQVHHIFKIIEISKEGIFLKCRLFILKIFSACFKPGTSCFMLIISYSVLSSTMQNTSCTVMLWAVSNSCIKSFIAFLEGEGGAGG